MRSNILKQTARIRIQVCDITNTLYLLGEEAQASPSIANTLWHVWMMFTCSLITPPEVNEFGWNLGNSKYIAWSCPWQILGAIRSAKFHKIFTKRRVSMCSVGALENICENLPVRGLFSPKTSILAWSKSKFPTSGIDFSETITNLGKSWQVGTPAECWLSIDTVGMNSKWFPWHVTPAHGEQT